MSAINKHIERVAEGKKLVGRMETLEEIGTFVEDLASRAKVVNIKIILDKIHSMSKKLDEDSEAYVKNA